MPFDLILPPWLRTSARADGSTHVSWDAIEGVRRVHIMTPVSLFRPGAARTSAVPSDFTAYVLQLRSHGVRFTDQAETTISGYPATLVTATTTTSASLDGVLGCPEAGLAAEHCFGFQPDLLLRMAVIDVDGRPLLIWLQADANPERLQDLVAPFEKLLSGFHLRPVLAASGPLDGTWATTYTLHDLATTPLLLPDDLNDDSWGTETISFAQSTMVVTLTGSQTSTRVPCRFRLRGNALLVDTPLGDHLVMRWRVDRGTLTLTSAAIPGAAPMPLVLQHQPQPVTQR